MAKKLRNINDKDFKQFSKVVVTISDGSKYVFDNNKGTVLFPGKDKPVKIGVEIIRLREKNRLNMRITTMDKKPTFLHRSCLVVTTIKITKR